MSKEEKNIQNTEGGKKTRRRKKKKLKFIIPVVAVLVVVIVVKSFSGKKSVAIPVYTDKISVGDIDTELNVSGKVVAEESVTFFAPAEQKWKRLKYKKVILSRREMYCYVLTRRQLPMRSKSQN